ncbi:ATP-binding protein [Streptomyces sp. SBST2-5]|uniref:ATP-binding protein n=1 Tax=Streptomyces composti TaxID=2720025 RepID=A0ABX1A4K2_9ACTN|nr:ATP-binding protein [Streptomyces composti]NJP50331.1 ATP-binding protein [Streptomyces composti]
MNQSAPPHTTPHPAPCSRGFTQLLSATRRGARLARLLGVGQLRSWEVPQDLVERAEVVIAELAANAVLHGHVPGRCFRLTLVSDPACGLLRVEVSDARGDLHPRLPAATGDPGALRTGGRGLTLIAALADHWDCVPYPPAGKTVRAVLSTPGPSPGPPGTARNLDG